MQTAMNISLAAINNQRLHYPSNHNHRASLFLYRFIFFIFICQFFSNLSLYLARRAVFLKMISNVGRCMRLPYEWVEYASKEIENCFLYILYTKRTIFDSAPKTDIWINWSVLYLFLFLCVCVCYFFTLGCQHVLVCSYPQ